MWLESPLELSSTRPQGLSPIFFAMISNNDAIVGLATHGSPILAYRPNGLIKPEPASRSVAELEALRALLEAAQQPDRPVTTRTWWRRAWRWMRVTG